VLYEHNKCFLSPSFYDNLLFFFVAFVEKLPENLKNISIVLKFEYACMSTFLTSHAGT
jgi:hypothetical protein